MFRKILFVFTIVSASLACNAQTTPIPTSYVNAVKEYMIAANAATTVDVTIKNILDQYKQMYPNLPKAFFTKMETKIRQSFNTRYYFMVAEAFYKHFTINEVKQLTAFYKSPVGAKFAQESPALTTELYNAGVKWGTEIGEQVVNEMKSQGYK